MTLWEVVEAGEPTLEGLAALSREEQLALMQEATEFLAEDRRQNALLYYKPVSEEAQKIHLSTAKNLAAFGGNGSSKTETCLVDIIIQATGMVPFALRGIYPWEKVKCPASYRVVVESLTTTLQQIILPKLQYDHWDGIDAPGGARGHWGWIPKRFLIGEDWQKSWSSKTSVLRLSCGCTIQFMCFRGDQRVLMGNGEWRPIATVKAGDHVWTPAGDCSVRQIFAYESAPLYRIRVSGGRELVCTAGHRHAQEDGSLVRTDELAVGDTLATVDTGKRIADVPRKRWELGWLALMIGDGYLGNPNSIELTATPGNRVLSDLPSMPPSCRLVSMPSDERRWRVWLTGRRNYNPLVQLLKSDGLIGKKSREKFVPDWVFRQPPRQIAYFLRHLWNCDGTHSPRCRQAWYVTISRRLAFDVKYLLWAIGIPASIREADYACGFTGKPVHRYDVVVSGEYDRFMALWAGKRWAHMPNHRRVSPGKVRSIEPIAPAPVYGLEVDHPDHLFVVDGVVTENSHSQDPQDFASGSFHAILHDEVPKRSVWRENRARVMRAGGRLYLAMTPPDEAGIPVDWVYDDLYEPGQTESRETLAVTLFTERNPHLDQGEVARRATEMTLQEREVRLHGRFLTLSNLVHPLFSAQPQWWCFPCSTRLIAPQGEACPVCGSRDIVQYQHSDVVWTYQPTWPVVFVLDPHPRRPHAMAWIALDPSDDAVQIAERELDADPSGVAQAVEALERDLGLQVCARLMDPNMGASPSRADRRDATWQKEFANAGLRCSLANDSFLTGKSRINEALKPDPKTRQPRMRVTPGCKRTAFQFARYSFDEWARYSTDVRDPKELPKRKHDDFPALWRYFWNGNFSFRGLRPGGEILQTRRRGRRRQP